MNKKQIVVFSHGFGVRKDDRGLFTDLADSFDPDTLAIMFDYNDVSESDTTLTVRPFSQQAKMLVDNLRVIKQRHPDLPTTIIGHSQGCVIAALAAPSVKKVIMLAPSPSLDVGRLVKNFSNRPGSVIDLEGVSKLTRRDGSVRLIGSDYLDELRQTDPIKHYKLLTSKTRLVMIRATQDEVLGQVDYGDLDNAQIIDIEANHDFTGDARAKLIEIVRQELI